MKVVESKKENGVMIIPECPGCENMHFVNTKISGRPKWGFNGRADAPTFTPSILSRYMDKPQSWVTLCHNFVTDGKIKFLSDCPHKLAGKTVDLPEIDEESSFYKAWELGDY